MVILIWRAVRSSLYGSLRGCSRYDSLHSPHSQLEWWQGVVPTNSTIISTSSLSDVSESGVMQEVFVISEEIVFRKDRVFWVADSISRNFSSSSQTPFDTNDTNNITSLMIHILRWDEKDWPQLEDCWPCCGNKNSGTIETISARTSLLPSISEIVIFKLIPAPPASHPPHLTNILKNVQRYLGDGLWLQTAWTQDAPKERIFHYLRWRRIRKCKIW